MKTITLEEFAEFAKKDEALKEKIVRIITMKGGTQTDAMIALAAEQGYKLTLEEKIDNLEGLSDDALEAVSGGVKAEPGSKNSFCEWIMEFFGYDIGLCY